jgi:hydroxysqualene dehydroxylase
MNNDNIFDCIVLGAGVSGIHSALLLAQQNKRVLLLESTLYIGGRARSFIDKQSGDCIDNGQHALMGCYTHFLSILSTLKTDSLLHRQHHLSVPFMYSDGHSDILKADVFSGALGVAFGIMNLKKLSLSEKISALYFAIRIRLGFAKSGSLTAFEFLLSENQSAHSIDILWTPIILATLNGHPKEVAASLFVQVLTLAFLGKKDASTLILPKVGLSDLLSPFPDWLAKHNGICKLGELVEEVVFKDKKPCAVLTKSGEIYHSNSIIMAIPPKSIKRIIHKECKDHEFYEALDQYTFSPIISVYLWIDVEFPDIEFAALLGTNTQWVFHKNAFMQNNISSTLLSCTVSAGNNSIDDEGTSIAIQCLQEIKLCFPSIKHAKLLHWKVIKEKQATFLATPEIENKRHSTHTDIEGLFIAGDWTDTKLPATLEGAAISGYHAANAVLTSKSTVFSHS